jgi:hypothetical protein
MPIAKETLRIGFTIVALPGTYVDQEGVDQYGWKDKVDPDPKKTTKAEKAKADK